MAGDALCIECIQELDVVVEVIEPYTEVVEVVDDTEVVVDVLETGVDVIEVETGVGMPGAPGKPGPPGPAAADATTTSKGVVQLAGDLAGTAAAPTVPGAVKRSLYTAKGTMLAGSAVGNPYGLGVGANGTVLTANSAMTPGVYWAAPTVPAHTHPEIGGTHRFLFDATPVGDPGTGRLSVENTGGQNRLLRVSKTDADGGAVNLALLVVNDSVALSATGATPAIYARGYAYSVIVDSGTYWELSVTRESGVGVLPADATPLLLSVTLANGMGAAPGAPTLDEVLTAGNTSSQTISLVGDTAGESLDVKPTHIEMLSESNQALGSIGPDQASFQNLSGSVYSQLSREALQFVGSHGMSAYVAPNLIELKTVGIGDDPAPEPTRAGESVGLRGSDGSSPELFFTRPNGVVLSLLPIDGAAGGAYLLPEIGGTLATVPMLDKAITDRLADVPTKADLEAAKAELREYVRDQIAAALAAHGIT